MNILDLDSEISVLNFTKILEKSGFFVGAPQISIFKKYLLTYCLQKEYVD